MWLLGCSCNQNKINISNHLHHLRKDLNMDVKSYDNTLIKGDLNSKISENCLNGFCNLTVSKLRNPTCIKNDTISYT